MDRGAWQATAQRVTESDTTEQLSTHIPFSLFFSAIVVLETEDRPMHEADKIQPYWASCHQEKIENKQADKLISEASSMKKS